jgi:hypothetical protein
VQAHYAIAEREPSDVREMRGSGNQLSAQ